MDDFDIARKFFAFERNRKSNWAIMRLLVENAWNMSDELLLTQDSLIFSREMSAGTHSFCFPSPPNPSQGTVVQLP